MAAHPWSTASHVAGLTGIQLSSVYYYLGQLIDGDLVQTASVPLVRSRLHAPSSAGIVKLAGGRRKARSYARALGLDSYHLAGALLRARALSWARDFLVELATSVTGGRLQWAISPHRVSVGRRLLKLDAYGSALWLGNYHRFAVLADPGGLSVQGYLPMFKMFLRWCFGSAFGGAGDRPVLVMLTTYNLRAQQLLSAWNAELRKSDRNADTEFFVGLSGPGVERSASRWWRGGEASKGALWRGFRGSHTAIPRPQPSLVSSPSSRRVRVQDVHQWMAGTQRGQVLNSYLALSGQAWRVLNQVGRWPLLRSGDLALLGNYGTTGAGLYAGILEELTERGLVNVVRKEDADRALLSMQHAQLMGRVDRAKDPASRVTLITRALEVEDQLSRAPGDPTSVRRYVLSPSGLELLAAVRGMSPLAYGRARLWPVGYEEIDGTRVVVVRIKRLLLSWHHTLLVNEFFLGLRRLAEAQWAMERTHRLLIWDSWECRRWFFERNRRQVLLPDSGGVYQVGREVYDFWLEMDRGVHLTGEHTKTLKRKIERYYLYRHRPDRLHDKSMPRLLFVTRQLGRAQLVRDAVMALAAERREPPLPVYITTLDDIWLWSEKGSGGVLEPRHQRPTGPGHPRLKRMWPGLKLWRRADDFGHFTYCFEGLDRMPPGTQRGLHLGHLRREVRAHTNRSRAQRKRWARAEEGEECSDS